MFRDLGVTAAGIETAMAVREELKSLLFECAREYADQSGVTVELQEQTPLIGPESAVDSLGLVMLVTGFEAKLNEKYDAAVVLANERAMSMNHSPFRSVEALSEYAEELLREAGKT